ncbi:MAG: hypothetical protein OQK69_10785 [Gammaproteobacteria bacterium]|nr:hypothetical protein [Gammaproteobacteria bacterium]
MTFELKNKRRDYLSFFGLFSNFKDGGIFKKPRISAHFVPISHFDGLCAGENIAVLRGFGCFLRGYWSFLRIFTLSVFAPLYIFISLKNKKKYKERGLRKCFFACAVLYIRQCLPTRFFMGCAVFSRSFRAQELLLNQCVNSKIGQMRGCAGYFAPGCWKFGGVL